MADLITTDEEKASASYLDWDDEALGRLVKYVALRWDALRQDEEGLRRVLGTSCAMQMVAICIDMNAAEFGLKLGDFDHGGLPFGDWRVVVTRLPPEEKGRGE